MILKCIRGLPTGLFVATTGGGRCFLSGGGASRILKLPENRSVTGLHLARRHQQIISVATWSSIWSLSAKLLFSLGGA